MSRRAVFLIAIWIWCDFGIAAPSECDVRLHANIATVTENALLQGRIDVEQLSEMANSQVPVDPFAAHQPRTDALALKKFYQMMLPQVNDWPALQAELRRILARHDQGAQLIADARVATADVFSVREMRLPTLQTREILAFLKTRDHRLLYAYFDEENHNFEVRDFANHEPMWAGSLWEAPGFHSLAEDANGEIKMLSFIRHSRHLRWRDGFLYPRLLPFAKRVTDVRTGKISESLFFYPPSKSTYEFLPAASGPDMFRMRGEGVLLPLNKKRLEPMFEKKALYNVFAGRKGENMIIKKGSKGHMQIWWAEENQFAPRLTLPFQAGLATEVAAKQLPDGRFAFAVENLDGDKTLTYYSPSFKGESAGQRLHVPGEEFSDHRILLTADGRVLVAVWLHPGDDRRFALYEPARSSDPIFITPGTAPMPYTFDIEEVGGRLFMMLSGDQENFALYEPLVSSAPLLRLTLPEYVVTYGIYAPSATELIFYAGNEGPLRAYSLLNPSRQKE